MTYLVLFVCC